MGEEPFFEPAFKIGFPFNMMIKQLEKQLEKEMKQMDRGMNEPPTFDEDEKIPTNSAKAAQPRVEGFSINISTSSNGQPVIKFNQIGDNNSKVSRQTRKIVKDNCKFASNITDTQAEEFSKLPKEDPKTSVRRLTDRIIYEIILPGVKENDLIISKMENSIEIKAFTKDKAFFKLIPVSLPILSSQLEDNKLILELKPEN